MKCYACDRMLNDFEATRKSKSTGEYLDMCNKCYSTVEDSLEAMARDDFDEQEVPDEEIVFDEDFDGGDYYHPLDEEE